MSGFALLDTLRLETGEPWGDVAADVQRADAATILDASFSRGRVRRARRRAQDLEQAQAVFHWLGRARGWSKTSDLAAILLEVLVTQAPPGSRSYGFAADRDQAALLVDALAGFIRRGGPKLAAMFEVQAWKIIVGQTGASLEAMAADEASAWGLRPFFVVCDELPMWPTTRGAHRLWEAISSAVPKTDGGRLVVAGTAGDPSHWSARVREHALEDDLWRVSETHGPPPWMDEQLIAEQKRRLPDSSFQRLFLNQWVSGEDRLVAEEDLLACLTLDGPQDPEPGRRYVIGLDVGLKRDRTAACVCHLEGAILTLDRIETWQGSRLHPVSLSDLEEWLVMAASTYGAQVVVDPWQAAMLVERLKRRSVRIEEFPFTAQSVGRIASTLYQLLHERTIRLPHDEALLDELRSVRLRETSPGLLRLDHDSGRHDDMAIALALACHRLVKQGEVRPMQILNPARYGARLPRLEGSIGRETRPGWGWP